MGACPLDDLATLDLDFATLDFDIATLDLRNLVSNLGLLGKKLSFEIDVKVTFGSKVR